MTNHIKTEPAAEYNGWTADEVITQALIILERRLDARRLEVCGKTHRLTSPKLVTDFMRLQIAGSEREHFGALFLNSQHYVLAHEVLFSGTIDEACVYPRVIVQKALAHNAAAVIVYHNHPSGTRRASAADERMTVKLKEILDVVDVRLLDHFIIGSGLPTSLAEQGVI